MYLEKHWRPARGSADSFRRIPTTPSGKLITLVALLFSLPLLVHAEDSLRFEDSVACAEGLSGSARTRILRAGFTDTSLAEAVLELVELDLESRRAIMEHVRRADPDHIAVALEPYWAVNLAAQAECLQRAYIDGDRALRFSKPGVEGYLLARGERVVAVAVVRMIWY